MAADNLTGRTLGQFEIIEEIGRGGMATVYRAKQKSINRMVAVKVLPRSLLHDPGFYERFLREVDVIAHLEHPHILPIYDYGEAEGIPYIAMRYLGGGSFQQLIRRGVPPIGKIVTPFTQVALALDHAHQNNVIHRDLKPGNILLDENGNAYLSDFGIAKISNSNMTGSAIVGTPAYMSPEQANGQPLDARSDIYALGIVLFQLLTGREPFEAETPLALLLRHINDPLPAPSLYRPNVPSEIEDVVFTATAKHPDDRYPSAGAVAADLQLAYEQASARGWQDDSPTSDEDSPTMLTNKATTPPMTPATPRTPVTPRTSAPRTASPRLPTRAPTTMAAKDNNPTLLPPAPEPTMAAAGGATEIMTRGRRTGMFAGIGAGVVVVILIGVMAALGVFNPPPPAPTPLPAPTPFPGAQRVERAEYAVTVPLGWQYVQTPNGDYWDDSPLNAGSMINNYLTISVVGGVENLDTVIADYADVFDDPSVMPLDSSTAPDGSARFSYRRIMPDGRQGQMDVFYLKRLPSVVVVQLFSADALGNQSVGIFQRILDSIRLAPRLDNA